jgi:tRNA threonylcarbamoyl adenosine modification protein (Sua5/YciO/YrdC/YwlC family)
MVNEILSLATQRDEALKRARDTLRAGDLVVVPTDTVYGLAADAFNLYGTAKIFDAKKRPRSLPIPVLVSDHRQAWSLCATVPQAAKDLAAAFWPGPLTMILPEADALEWDLGESKGTVALRMPAHDDLLALLHMTGPLAVTSANRSGEPTPRTCAEVTARLGDTVALSLDDGPSESDTGSTIVDLANPHAAVIREGPIPALDVLHRIRESQPLSS